MAEELREESFAKHSLLWVDSMDYIASELHKCGSRTKLYLAERLGTVELTSNLNVVQSQEDQAGNESAQDRPQLLHVPHPLTHYWKLDVKQCSIQTKEGCLPLPPTFSWLVGVGSNLCEAPRSQIITLLGFMQNSIRAKKCS